MMNGNTKKIKKILDEAFRSGYTNAAVALAQMANDRIYYNNFDNRIISIEDRKKVNTNLNLPNSSNILLTTEIFGGMVGKSYLVISEKEYAHLTQGMPDKKNSEFDFKEEFAKELDNILSASVISKLSEELDMKMYGDIPIMYGKVGNNIDDVIYKDFSERAYEVYINSIFFSFENSPAISPFFIWVVDANSISKLEMTLAD